MRKKVKLSVKKEEGTTFANVDSFFKEFTQPLMFSGFCLTDNQNFGLLFVDNKFLIDKGINVDVKQFSLTENELNLTIDRENNLIPSKGSEKVTFDGIGMVDRKYYDMFKSIYPDCVFHPVHTWFDKRVNTLVAVLKEKYGKIIGIIKTHSV
jgi:hypothetical protein